MSVRAGELHSSTRAISRDINKETQRTNRTVDGGLSGKRKGLTGMRRGQEKVPGGEDDQDTL